MSTEVAFPPAFEAYMREKLGNGWRDFQSAHEHPSPVSIRINPLKNNSATHGLDSVPWTLYGKYLSERPVFTLDPLFHAGTYYVQEPSSMFIEQVFKQVVDLNQPLNVLDLSAAPGGKSTHILSLINSKSFLVSNEVIRSRASILSENIQKWGYPNSIVTNNDPKDFTSLSGFFDIIVVDAPCSGEGLFRKDAKAMDEWSPQNVDLCSARQKRILEDVWPALKENGILIYCTCTYNESENENNLLALSQSHNVEFIDLQLDATWKIEKVIKGDVIGYRFFPHQVKGEGFFLSAFRKKEKAGKINSRNKHKLITPSKKITDALGNWIQEPSAYGYVQHNDLIFKIPVEKLQELEMLLHHLRFVYAGTNLATVKHDKLIPDQALALAISINREAFKIIEVDEKQAIQYLRREAPLLSETQKGFALLTHQDTPIGWVNVLQNRVNNMYPQEWRIRMAPLSQSQS